MLLKDDKVSTYPFFDVGPQKGQYPCRVQYRGKRKPYRETRHFERGDLVFLEVTNEKPRLL
jgi:hypothetical protein